MTAGSSMLAMILNVPPQRVQVSSSIQNARFNRHARLIATRHGVAVLATHAQISMLEAAALQIRLELLLHVSGRRSTASRVARNSG